MDIETIKERVMEIVEAQISSLEDINDDNLQKVLSAVTSSVKTVFAYMEEVLNDEEESDDEEWDDDYGEL
jgi:hypothetical protein